MAKMSITTSALVVLVIRLSMITAVLGGSIVTVTPSSCAVAGGCRVTISGSSLAVNLPDIPSVTFCGVEVSTKVFANSAAVIVTVAPAVSAGLGNVVVSSTANGVATGVNKFTYIASSSITSVIPATGARIGGYYVTIFGAFLNNGSDTTTALLAGTPVLQIVSQNSSVVVVRAGSATLPVRAGAVNISSISGGNLSKAAAFTYLSNFTVLAASAVAHEAGAPATVEVHLDSAPISSVQLSIGNSPLWTSLSTNLLTFDASNWNISQVVSVSAAHDFIVTGARVFSITIGPASSSDVVFNGVGPQALTLSATDADTAGITLLNNSTSPIAMLEGNITTFALRLTSAPQADVVVTIQSSDAYLTALYSTNIVFGAGNWSTVQSVVMFASRDTTAVSRTVTVSIWTNSSDPVYNSLPVTLQSVFIIDTSTLDNAETETPLVLLSAPSGILFEGGADVQMFLVMIAQVSALSVNLTAQPPLVAITPPSFILTSADYLTLHVFNISTVNNQIAESDIWVNVTATASTGTQVSLTTVPVLRRNDDVAGIAVSHTSVTVNEHASSALVQVWATSQPLAGQPVVVTFACSNSAWATIRPAQVVFTETSYTATITITGQRDMDDLGDKLSFVSVNISSADGGYALTTAAAMINVTTTQIWWPQLFSVSPEVIPMIGRTALFIGRDFKPGVRLFIGTEECDNVTWISDTELQVQMPVLNISGYLNITVQNPDLGSGSQVDVVYYTPSCPEVGMYGTGLTCQPCPAGAYCPGGNRMWPLPGWWNSGEWSGFVVACDTPASVRCLGGRFSLCGAGYTGPLCSSCLHGYYEDAGACNLCESDGYIATLILLQMSFLLILVVVAALMDQNALDNMMFFLLNCRALWVIAANARFNMPPVVQNVLGVLNLLAGDLSFVHPDCFGVSSFVNIFSLNFGVIFGALIPFALLVEIRYRIRLFRTLHDGSQKFQAEIKHATTEWKRKQLACGGIAVVAFCYEVVAVNSLEMIYCIPVGDQLLLAQDPNQVCFVGGHIPLFIISICALLVINVGLPVAGLVFSLRSKQRHLSLMQEAVVDVMTNEYSEQCFYFGIAASIIIDLNFAILNLLLDSNSLLRVILVVGVLLLQIGFVIIKRPFSVWFKNVGIVLTISSTLLAAGATFAMASGNTAAAHALGYTLVSLLLLYTASAVLLFILSCLRVNVSVVRLARPAAVQMIGNQSILQQRRATLAANTLSRKTELKYSDQVELLQVDGNGFDDNSSEADLSRASFDSLPRDNQSVSSAEHSPLSRSRADSDASNHLISYLRSSDSLTSSPTRPLIGAGASFGSHSPLSARQAPVSPSSKSPSHLAVVETRPRAGSDDPQRRAARSLFQRSSASHSPTSVTNVYRDAFEVGDEPQTETPSRVGTEPSSRTLTPRISGLAVTSGLKSPRATGAPTPLFHDFAPQDKLLSPASTRSMQSDFSLLIGTATKPVAASSPRIQPFLTSPEEAFAEQPLSSSPPTAHKTFPLSLRRKLSNASGGQHFPIRHPATTAAVVETRPRSISNAEDRMPARQYFITSPQPVQPVWALPASPAVPVQSHGTWISSTTGAAITGAAKGHPAFAHQHHATHLQHGASNAASKVSDIRPRSASSPRRGNTVDMAAVQAAVLLERQRRLSRMLPGRSQFDSASTDTPAPE